MLWEMMDGSFLFWRICLLWFFSAATPPAYFCFSLSIYFAFFAWKECVSLLQKGMMGILGPGAIMWLDSRSSVLSLFYIVWKSFLESEKRHGIGVF